MRRASRNPARRRRAALHTALGAAPHPPAPPAHHPPSPPRPLPRPDSLLCVDSDLGFWHGARPPPRGAAGVKDAPCAPRHPAPRRPPAPRDPAGGSGGARGGPAAGARATVAPCPAPALPGRLGGGCPRPFHGRDRLDAIIHNNCPTKSFTSELSGCEQLSGLAVLGKEGGWPKGSVVRRSRVCTATDGKGLAWALAVRWAQAGLARWTADSPPKQCVPDGSRNRLADEDLRHLQAAACLADSSAGERGVTGGGSPPSTHTSVGPI